jgi:phosphatidylglycerol:prolipoprotein diacylglycerol transferase
VHPVLWSFTLPAIGAVSFPAYATFLLVGFALALHLARRAEERSGRSGARIIDLGVLLLISGVAGARLLSVLADGHLHDYVNLCVAPVKVTTGVCSSVADCADGEVCDTLAQACHPTASDCLEVVKIWHGGLAYYGGFLLATAVALLYARRHQLGVLRLADRLSPYVPLGLAFGRVGCFLNGCCYGRACDLPWGVRFPGRGGPVHPTQLYEAAGALAIFALLDFVWTPRKRGDGEVFGGLLVLYGALRFALEFWRADERGELLGLSTSQWIGLPLIALGVGLIVRARRNA